MSAFIELAVPGIEVFLGGARLRYKITQTTDYNEAKNALLATAPATFNGTVNAHYECNDVAWGVWEGIAEYGVPEETTRPDQEDDKTYKSFTTTGGTAHITQSIQTVNSYCRACRESQRSLWEWKNITSVPDTHKWVQVTRPATQAGCKQKAPADPPNPTTYGQRQHGTVVPKDSGELLPGEIYVSSVAPDFGGAIGVTKDSIEGTDITVPEFKFQGKAYLNDSKVTDDFIALLMQNTGRVNSVDWKMFLAGEVLFLGATGSREGRSNWEVTFDFAAYPNVTGLSVADITGIEKKGWEYLWVRYADEEDDAAHALVRKPQAVYVEQVYPYSDFSFLEGIF